MITMLLGGLWHGASLNFIFWGGLHGLALVVDKLRARVWPHPGRFGSFLGWIVTFHFVCFCWIFFRATDFQLALGMLTRIGTAFHPELALQFIMGYPVVVILLALGALLHATPVNAYEALRAGFSRAHPLLQAVALSMMIVLVAEFQTADIQPFIYFQF